MQMIELLLGPFLLELDQCIRVAVQAFGNYIEIINISILFIHKILCYTYCYELTRSKLSPMIDSCWVKDVAHLDDVIC